MTPLYRRTKSLSENRHVYYNKPYFESEGAFAFNLAFLNFTLKVHGRGD